MAQLSTAFSDLLLAISCMYCVRQLLGYSLANRTAMSFAKTGFSLILIASSLGVIRFGKNSPPAWLIKCHKYASYLASVPGISCLAAEFYHQANFPSFGNLHLYASAGIIILQMVLSHKIHATLADFVSSAAVVSILLLCSLYKNLAGCIGAGTVLVVGLLTRTEGHLLGLPVVDFFHYGLIVANWCFVQALTKG